MTGVAEVGEALHALRGQPYGPARIAAAERIVDRAAETGNRPLLIDALQEQVSAYTHGGQRQRMLVPFARMLKLWDERPEDFGERARYGLFWQFKWATTGMVRHPDVPLSAIRHWLSEMERRYRIAGHGLQPVYAQHHHLAVHLGDREAAARSFDEWTTADRTEMSDCHACELNTQGDWLESNGQDAEAVRVWAPVLRGEHVCLEEPHDVLTKSLLPLVRLGRLDEARANHLRGYRMVRGNPNLLDPVGRHIEFAALTGNEARGLEMLADHAGSLELDSTDGVGNRLGLYEGAALLLRRLCDLGQDAMPLSVPPGRATTVAALLAAVRAATEAVGRRFDERNGTTAVSDRTRARLAAEPLLTGLPLGVRTRTVVVVPVPPSTVDEVGAAPDVDALIAAATDLAAARDRRAAQAWERVAVAADGPLPPVVQARIAESRAVENAGSDTAGAVDRFLAVAAQFVEVGDPARAAVNRARAGLAAALSGRDTPDSADPQAVYEQLVALREAGADGGGNSGGAVTDRDLWTVRLCAARTRLARWIAASGEDPDGGPPTADPDHRAELAAMVADAEREGARYELAEALLNQAQMALTSGDLAAAVPSLDRAVDTYVEVDALGQAANAIVMRARVALGEGDPAGARTVLLRTRRFDVDRLEPVSRAEIAALLAETHMRTDGYGPAAVEALTAADLFDQVDPAAAVELRRRAAFAFERDDRPAEAAALLESVLPELEQRATADDTADDAAVELAAARQQYGRCLRALGEFRDAARTFIAAASLVRDWPDQVPHASLTHDAGNALESAGQPEEAEAAFRRAAQLWLDVGDPDAATRAIRAAAWTLVQRDKPDLAGATDLLTRAALMSEAERPETQYQNAQLQLDWADAGPSDGTGDGERDRILALADEAATGFRERGDLDRAIRADLLAADVLGAVRGDRAAARARIARARESAAAAGADPLVRWCDSAAARWAD